VHPYQDLFFMKEKPVSLAFLERFAQEVLNWSALDTSLKITDFYLEKNIPNQVYYRWVKKYDFMKEAHETAMRRIASRREVGALTRKYDAGSVREFQALCDPEYREFIKWRSELRNKEDAQGGGTIVVHLPPTPLTAEVPERVKE
jgi:hypothetical protein